MRNRPYEKFIVWQKAHALCLQVYTFTRNFPDTERYGLTSQMRRSSASIPTNIVEGSNKLSTKEKARYYETSICSLEELHYQCILAKDLGYIPISTLEELRKNIDETGFLLSRLIQSVRKNTFTAPSVPPVPR